MWGPVMTHWDKQAAIHKADGRVGCPNYGSGSRGWGAVAFLAPAYGKFNIDTISRLAKDTQNLAAG